MWFDLEDYLVPLLNLKPGERAVYSHLLRHWRLVGQREVRLSHPALGRGACVSKNTARVLLHRLARKGCVKKVSRGLKGIRLEILLPQEILRRRLTMGHAPAPERTLGPTRRNPRLRRAILHREGGRCFYCLRKLRRREVVFDHIVPVSRGGRDGMENNVACCRACNLQKQDEDAADFLRVLYRANRLNARELEQRLVALGSLRAANRSASSGVCGGFSPTEPPARSSGSGSKLRRCHAGKSRALPGLASKRV